ncbi:hypothetical protein, partial [Nitrosomonas sp.]|uniref:hypothetical protein n=1 Tax=Nitrosomonas sp. TaxID=42353 RepID=UPI001DDB6057
ALGAKLIYTDYLHLLFEIHSAKHEEKSISNKNAVGRNSAAQLRSMNRIKSDTKLIEAVQNTDIKTFMMISVAQTDLISEKMKLTGYFIDSGGMRYNLHIPSLDQCTPIGKYYLPDGITGLRDAVSLALQRCIVTKEKRGRRTIKSRRLLADKVWSILRKYRPDANQTIWHWGTCNYALVFAHEVFKEVNPVINLDILVKLMKERGYTKKGQIKPCE